MSKLVSELRRRNVLRVAALYLVSAWLIAQVTDVVTGLAGWPPSVGRAVLVILACGFPVAVGLAWLFEWTPAGIRREAASGGAAEPPRRQRMDYVILAVLVVALGYFAANHDWSDPVVEASIAVLPFDNRSDLPDDRFFVDGVHDDLLTQLAKIQSLVVISRTSVLRFRDSDLPIPDIAKELGVATILEGGVQRAGGQVRINLQLIEGATDRHLWAETYDRPLTAENVFEIQSEITTTIAATLHAKLLPEERQRIDAMPTDSLAAWDLYHEARERFGTRDLEGLVEAERLLLEAIEIDPKFALAHARLADVLAFLSEWDPATGQQSIARAEAAAARALAIDPQLGDAYTSRGVIKYFRGAAPEEYLADMQRGVELAPGSADARKWYSGVLADLGRYEEGLAQIRKAAELDPMSPIIQVNLGGALERIGRAEEAQARYARALEIDPTFLPALFSLAETGSLDDRLARLSGALPAAAGDGFFLLEFVATWLDLGDAERAGRWVAAMEAAAPQSVAALIGRMQVSLYAGDLAAASAYAEQLLIHEDGSMPIPSRVLAMRDVAEGDAAAALARYETKYPQLFTATPPVASYAIVASDIAAVLLELGETDRARELLTESLAALLASHEERGQYPELLEARAHALLGDEDVALAKLRQLVDCGWTWRWWLFFRHDLAFAGLRDDQRFSAIASDMAARMQEQLEHARAREAAGEIALPPGQAATAR